MRRDVLEHSLQEIKALAERGQGGEGGLSIYSSLVRSEHIDDKVRKKWSHVQKLRDGGEQKGQVNIHHFLILWEFRP